MKILKKFQFKNEFEKKNDLPIRNKQKTNENS